MKIRKFREDDKIQLIKLWQSVFPDDPPHNEPSAVIDAKLKVDDLIFIAESNGELIGACMAGYDGHRGWLYAVAVDPAQRRMGIGENLVQRTMRALKDLGCIKVNLQIRSTNTAVAAFYRVPLMLVIRRLDLRCMGTAQGRQNERRRVRYRSSVPARRRPPTRYSIAGSQVASPGKAAMITMPIRNNPTNGQVAANTSPRGTSCAAPLKAKMV